MLYKINFLLQSMPGVIALRGHSVSQLDLPLLLYGSLEYWLFRMSS